MDPDACPIDRPDNSAKAGATHCPSDRRASHDRSSRCARTDIEPTASTHQPRDAAAVLPPPKNGQWWGGGAAREVCVPRGVGSVMLSTGPACGMAVVAVERM